ncbi:GNAT family N-acetyltransferase [Streptomyces sp. NPDC058614]|uniref:GNAT family N-acetyltransferase n=1 Tax=Streptomyces sp. NPDC058614 TaxID=3346557 RepID=UPI0036556C0D
MDKIVRAWVDGWVVSRGAAPPVVEPWGYTVDVGQPEHVSRHVLGMTNEAVEETTVRKVADGVTGAGVWLKVFAEPSTVGPWLGEGWWVDPEPGYLMSVPLVGASERAAPDGSAPGSRTPDGDTHVVYVPDGHTHDVSAPDSDTHDISVPNSDTHDVSAPDGYRLRTWSRGGVTRVLLAAPDGSWAARGQIAPTGETAVVDQIETAARHRRRGFGRLVMRTLTHAAVAQGAVTGVLAGTPDGRALYESLGWRVEATLTSAKFTGGA